MLTKKITLLILCAFCFYSNADDITKVLQNGLNGYEGCTDSYMFKTDDDSSSFTKNFGSENFLVTAH